MVSCNLFRNYLLCAGTLTALSLFAVKPAHAQVIADPTGSYKVGIGTLGNLFDPSAYIGFQRVSDGYDPIAPGSPREAYGLSAGSVSGYVDPAYMGTNKVTANGASVFSANSAFVSTFLNNGTNLLRLNQTYTFAAANLLQIATSITNVSGSAQNVMYARNADWDIDPTFSNYTTADALSGPVTSASYYGFENPDPLAAFSSLTGATGGTFGPNDLGAGLHLSFGSLAAGQSLNFNIFEGISKPGETQAGLRAQATGFGAKFLLSGSDTNNPSTNYTLLGYGPTAVPEPGSIALLVGMSLSGVGFLARRRKQARKIA